jgi:hypothetical protein
MTVGEHEWHPVCLCVACGVESCDDVCCRCMDRNCPLLHHVHRLGEGVWPYHLYYRHGEDVLKFYVSRENSIFSFPLGDILSDWVRKQHVVNITE